jgi:hypothetical protein
MLSEPPSESFLQNNAIAVQNPYAIPLPDAGIKFAGDDPVSDGGNQSPVSGESPL